MKTTLAVFDFDATLVNSHGSEDGKRLYQELTGLPFDILNADDAKMHGKDEKFRRKGWWGRPETLLPPLVPRPVPTEFRIERVYQEYLKAKADPNTRSVLLTGRHSKIGPLVVEVLKDLGIEFDECYYKGGYPLVKHPNYPKDNDTPRFKVHAVVDHLIRPEHTRVVMWEDRKDIVDLFNTVMRDRIAEEHPHVDALVVNDVVENKAYCHALKTSDIKTALLKRLGRGNPEEVPQ